MFSIFLLPEKSAISFDDQLDAVRVKSGAVVPISGSVPTVVAGFPPRVI